LRTALPCCLCNIFRQTPLLHRPLDSCSTVPDRSRQYQTKPLCDSLHQDCDNLQTPTMTIQMLRSISTVVGRGSGHEPGSTGFVGRGLLSARVCGDVFTSPSERRVYGALGALPTKKETILIITNYCVSFLPFCVVDCLSLRACILVLRVSRRGWMELRT